MAASLDRSPNKNWIENQGGLPAYIREIASSIHKKRGLPISAAIPLAIGACQRWASGRGGVDADTRAKAVKALAELKAKGLRSKAATMAKLAGRR